MEHNTPVVNRLAFHCPHCGVYANQIWSKSVNVSTVNKKGKGTEIVTYSLDGFTTAKCTHCDMHSYWMGAQMIHPLDGSVAAPNEDMPDEIKADYFEARKIVNLSPRGAAALLRLALQKLCVALGEKGENINQDIKSLVAKGLPAKIQQALDSVRVVGNNAVHPGYMDLKDDYETAYKLFGFLNVICDVMITQPKKIQEFYEYKIPENLRDAIAKRDEAP